MIPLTLQIKNFLSYGPTLQAIDFSGYQLICLSGKNGHGKSALLDALTWAIWGQARKSSGTIKADHGLLHLGQTQMMVVLDFECNNQIYRVRREYAQTHGKPYANLEFGILDPSTDTAQPLTDKTIRKTQEKIEQTINLDFDSFINSAFLRQGQANEFSKKSPKDRKKILACILGLNRYEVVRAKAQEKVKQGQQERRGLCMLQEKVTSELAQTDLVLEELQKIKAELTTIATKEAEQAKHIQAISQSFESMQTKKTALSKLQLELAHCTQRQEELVQQLHTTRIQWKTVHAQKLAAPNTLKLTQRKQTLTQTITSEQQKLQKQLEIQQALLQHNSQLQELEQKQKSSNTTITLKIKQLKNELTEAKSNQQVCQTSITTLAKKITESGSLKTRLAMFEKHKDQYHTFVALGNTLQQELNQLVHKKKLSLDANNPSCPLCEQQLSASRKRFLQHKFNISERSITHKLTRLHRIIPLIKQNLITEHEQIQLANKHAEQTKLLLQYTAQIKQLTKHITEQQALLQTTQKEHNPAIVALQKQLTLLKNKITASGYNKKAHKQAITELTDISKKLEQYKTLTQELVRQTDRIQAIHTLCTQIKKLKRNAQTLTQQAQQYTAIENTIKDLKKQQESLAQEQKKNNERKTHLLQERGKLEQLKQLRTQKQTEAQQTNTHIKKCDLTINEYQSIALATSKDGVQALLIEDAIPEIEQEANTLLAKLTDNQAQIHIESLKDLKKGGTKETLDINISDSAGIRPYELFSGGEAFRIDFALRIAISKLLARRAGTALQTLIIDEGFGSQDEEGLGNIMQAIYAIQDDFCKVIIVSHLPAIKDQFPVHFYIEKGAHGSCVSVIEQG